MLLAKPEELRLEAKKQWNNKCEEKILTNLPKLKIECHIKRRKNKSHKVVSGEIYSPENLI